MGARKRVGAGVGLAGMLTGFVHVPAALAAPTELAMSGGLWSDTANWSTRTLR